MMQTKGVTLQYFLLAHTANAQTLFVSKMEKIRIYKSPYPAMWPDDCAGRSGEPSMYRFHILFSLFHFLTCFTCGIGMTSLQSFLGKLDVWYQSAFFSIRPDYEFDLEQAHQ